MTELSKRIANLPPEQRELLRQRFLARAPAPEPSAALVAVRPEGDGPPFFCAHPSGGNVLCYSDLARHMGAGVPFYGLQTPGLGGECEPPASVEEMARLYLRAVRGVQPRGPYFLGGYSMGGLVAYEMARQLAERGEAVGLLALLDMWVIDRADLPLIDEAATIVGIFGGGLPVTVEELRRLPDEARLTFALEQAKRAGLAPPELTAEQARRIVRVHQNNDLAAQNYVPPAYAGRVTLFRARDHRLLFRGQRVEDGDPTLGWGRLAAGGVEVYEVPGGHYEMISPPHVSTLAAELRGRIERARAETHAPA